MNIEQYRAIKAQEEAKRIQQTQEKVEQPEVKEDNKEENKEEIKIEQPANPAETKPEETTFEVGGQKLTIDELKNGYLRQADYTKKTQELSRQKSEAKEAIAFYNYLKANPQVAEQVKQNGGQVPDRVDPTLSKVKELEDKMYDMMLEREISELTNKYKDFEVKDVLTIASERGLTNLEDAYFIYKSRNNKESTVDVESLKEQIRQDLLKELQQEKQDTKTIITTNSPQVDANANKPTLNSSELKVAKMMKMSPEDYIKWRDVDKVKK